MTSLVRAKKLAQKRESRFFVAHLKEGQDPDLGQVKGGATASGNYKLGNLPENALILKALAFVITASGAVTSSVGTLGTASAGSQIMSAADLNATGVTGTFTGVTHTGTGKEVWLGITNVGGGTDAGEFITIIEYLECEMTCGEYTSLAE